MSTDSPVVVEQIYDAPASVVWQAITNRDQMVQWFFEPISEFDASVGFETGFDIEHEGQIYPHRWKVTEVIPQKKIAYEWRYGGIPGDSKVSWELSETPNGTKLTLTHSVVEPFPQDNPVFSRESGQAGWNYFICESLKTFLDGKAS